MSKGRSIILLICTTLGTCGQRVALAQGAGAVSVPVLVESKSGEIAYGLSANDFLIKDNGIGQRVEIQDGSQTGPLSFILVIQTGHGAPGQLDKIAHLGALLDSLLTNSQDRAAVITFDSRPRLFHDFAEDTDEISNSLASIAAGNSGAALFDAMHMAISLLGKVPAHDRKVIVLISGEHDHGSYASDNGSLIRDVSMSDASVYSLSFRAARKGFVGKLSFLGPFAVFALLEWRAKSLYSTDLDFLFPSVRFKGNTPLSPDSILEKSVRPALARIGVVGKHISWHSFRHSLATNLRSLGVDIKVAQELMRHSSCRTTLDVYTRAVDQQKREASLKVVELMLPLEVEKLQHPSAPSGSVTAPRRCRQISVNKGDIGGPDRDRTDDLFHAMENQQLTAQTAKEL